MRVTSKAGTTLVLSLWSCLYLAEGLESRQRLLQRENKSERVLSFSSHRDLSASLNASSEHLKEDESDIRPLFPLPLRSNQTADGSGDDILLVPTGTPANSSSLGGSRTNATDASPSSLPPSSESPISSSSSELPSSSTTPSPSAMSPSSSGLAHPSQAVSSQPSTTIPAAPSSAETGRTPPVGPGSSQDQDQGMSSTFQTKGENQTSSLSLQYGIGIAAVVGVVALILSIALCARVRSRRKFGPAEPHKDKKSKEKTKQSKQRDQKDKGSGKSVEESLEEGSSSEKGGEGTAAKSLSSTATPTKLPDQELSLSARSATQPLQSELAEDREPSWAARPRHVSRSKFRSPSPDRLPSSSAQQGEGGAKPQFNFVDDPNIDPSDFELLWANAKINKEWKAVLREGMTEGEAGKLLSPKFSCLASGVRGEELQAFYVAHTSLPPVEYVLLSLTVRGSSGDILFSAKANNAVLASQALITAQTKVAHLLRS